MVWESLHHEDAQRAGSGLPESSSHLAKACTVSDTDTVARGGFPVAKTLRTGTLPGYVLFPMPAPLSSGKRLVVAGAQAGNKWFYVDACKKLCLARAAARGCCCWRVLKSLRPTPAPSNSSVSQKISLPRDPPAKRNAYPSLITRSSLLSP